MLPRHSTSLTPLSDVGFTKLPDHQEHRKLRAAVPEAIFRVYPFGNTALCGPFGGLGVDDTSTQ